MRNDKRWELSYTQWLFLSNEYLLDTREMFHDRALNGRLFVIIRFSPYQPINVVQN
jgi:hypothetical protein